MKKIFVSILALTISFGSFAQATDKQKKDSRKEHHGKKHELAEKMNLTDAQKVQMKSLNESFKSKMQNLKQDQSLSEDARKQKRAALAAEHKQQVQSLLTPEQKKQWKENKAQYSHKGSKNKMHGDKSALRGKGGKLSKGGDRLEKMQKELNLSTDQSARLKSINENYKTSMQGVRKNSSLTSDQQKEQVSSLRKKHRQDIEAVLTAEQKATLKNSMKNRKQQHV